MMTTDERIITAVDVHSAEYTDGQGFDALLDRTQAAGIRQTEVYGDKAYFRKDILARIADEKAQAYILIHPCAYRINEERFSYNKDSGQWFCSEGNLTEKKTRSKNKKCPSDRYTFGGEQCQNCSQRAECFGKSKGKARVLTVALNTAGFYEISQWQKTEEFREHYKKRAAHEWKNGEMKQFHGLTRAKGYGLRAVAIQAKLTAIAVNMKRIAALELKRLAVFIASLKMLRQSTSVSC